MINFLKTKLDFSFNTVSVAVSQILKVGLLGSAFLLLARQLGPANFGDFVAVSALFYLFSPFVDMGLYHVNIQFNTNGEKLSRLLGGSIQTIAALSTILLPVAIFTATILFDLKILAIFFIGLEILVIEKLLPVANSLMVCTSKFKMFAIIEVIQGVARLLAVVILTLLNGKFMTWAFFFMLQGLTVSAALTFWMYTKFDFKFCSYPEIHKRINIGKSFLFASLLETSVQELDRIIIKKICDSMTVGFYGAIMRINNFALVPINAFFMTVYKKYFDQGKINKKNTLAHAIKTIKISLIISFLIAISIIVLRPVIVYLLGPEYGNIENVLALSAVIPIVYSLTQPLLDALSGVNKQTIRVKILIFVLIINIILLIFLLPGYHIAGAVASIIIARLTTIPIFIIYIFRNKKEWLSNSV